MDPEPALTKGDDTVQEQASSADDSQVCFCFVTIVLFLTDVHVSILYG